MLPSRPPLPGMVVSVTWTDTRYQQCLNDYLLGQGPLSSREVCDTLRWIAEDPWYRTDVSLGERRLPVFFPRLGLPQVVPGPSRTKEDLLHEPALEQVPTSTKKVLPKMAKPKLGERRGDFVWDGEGWYNTVLKSPPQTTVAGGDMASWDLGNITGRVIDLAMAKLQQQVLGPQSMAAAGGAVARGAAATAAGVAAALTAEEVLFGDDEKKHRHRRKRLATVSDIKDLAALKAVLGNGEAFKTWIATHSR